MWTIFVRYSVGIPIMNFVKIISKYTIVGNVCEWFLSTIVCHLHTSCLYVSTNVKSILFML